MSLRFLSSCNPVDHFSSNTSKCLTGLRHNAQTFPRPQRSWLILPKLRSSLAKWWEYNWGWTLIFVSFSSALIAKPWENKQRNNAHKETTFPRPDQTLQPEAELEVGSSMLNNKKKKRDWGKMFPTSLEFRGFLTKKFSYVFSSVCTSHWHFLSPLHSPLLC